MSQASGSVFLIVFSRYLLLFLTFTSTNISTCSLNMTVGHWLWLTSRPLAHHNWQGDTHLSEPVSQYLKTSEAAERTQILCGFWCFYTGKLWTVTSSDMPDKSDSTQNPRPNALRGQSSDWIARHVFLKYPESPRNRAKTAKPLTLTRAQEAVKLTTLQGAPKNLSIFRLPPYCPRVEIRILRRQAFGTTIICNHTVTAHASPFS